MGLLLCYHSRIYQILKTSSRQNHYNASWKRTGLDVCMSWKSLNEILTGGLRCYLEEMAIDARSTCYIQVVILKCSHPSIMLYRFHLRPTFPDQQSGRFCGWIIGGKWEKCWIRIDRCYCVDIYWNHRKLEWNLLIKVQLLTFLAFEILLRASDLPCHHHVSRSFCLPDLREKFEANFGDSKWLGTCYSNEYGYRFHCDGASNCARYMGKLHWSRLGAVPTWSPGRNRFRFRADSSCWYVFLLSTGFFPLTLSNFIWERKVLKALTINGVKPQASWIVKKNLLICLAVCAYLTSYVCQFMGPARMEWNGAVQKRVGITSSVLGQLKALKMKGLTEHLSKNLQSLRVSELKFSKKFRMLIFWLNLIGILP